MKWGESCQRMFKMQSLVLPVFHVEQMRQALNIIAHGGWLNQPRAGWRVFPRYDDVIMLVIGGEVPIWTEQIIITGQRLSLHRTVQ